MGKSFFSGHYNYYSSFSVSQVDRMHLCISHPNMHGPDMSKNVVHVCTFFDFTSGYVSGGEIEKVNTCTTFLTYLELKCNSRHMSKNVVHVCFFGFHIRICTVQICQKRSTRMHFSIAPPDTYPGVKSKKYIWTVHFRM